MSQTVFDRNAQVGEQVIFHHVVDGKDYPAIVSDVRATGPQSWPTVTPYTHNRQDLIDVEKSGALTMYAHLTIFRPNKIEWSWAVESENPGGYTRKEAA